MITYNADSVRLPRIRRRVVSRWIRQVAESYGRTVGEIGYLFTDDEHIIEVNRTYLGHDYYTDIITFDYSEARLLNGDIVISLDTVCTNAQLYGKSVDDELLRVIIHGVLHMCGLHDKTPNERQQMEQAEDNALRMLEDMGQPAML